LHAAQVPVYALASFFSLAFPAAGPYLDVVRELYEALTIYAFTWFVLAYLELDANLSFASFGELLASKPPLPHMWPLTRLLPPWQMGTPFIRAVQVRPCAAAHTRHFSSPMQRKLTCFCVMTDGRAQLRGGAPHHRRVRLRAHALRPLQVRQRRPTKCTRTPSIMRALLASSSFRAHHTTLTQPRTHARTPQAYIYLATINSVSQGWALYCLIMLYRATSSDLAGVKVLAKFLCVKGVVFFTFWQGLAVALGIRAGAIQHLIQPHGHDSEADLATRLQNFIIWCVPRARASERRTAS
jgi:hypothetical protein